MGNTRRDLKPDDPQMARARVVRTRRLSESFQRVTVAGPDIDGYPHVGLDQWFRIFLPRDGTLTPPPVERGQWWTHYLAMDDAIRPHCSNYTIAELRQPTDAPAELDIDVVLHDGPDGRPCGPVALWSVHAEPDSEVALLDQGALFDPPEDTTDILLVSDETGLPGLRGIVRDLGHHLRGRLILEVPTLDDVEDWASGPGLHIDWIVRAEVAPGEVPGRAALRALTSGPAPSDTTYAFVVGESGLATGARRWLCRQGLSKERVFFSGYWKHEGT